jgi:ribose-phosphate pyrophosphokinase
MISTAGTICGAAHMVKRLGALKIVAGATHGVFSAAALERLQDAPIDEVVVTDTIPMQEKMLQLKTLKVLSVAALLGEAIRRIHINESVSSMFPEG